MLHLGRACRAESRAALEQPGASWDVKIVAQLHVRERRTLPRGRERIPQAPVFWAGSLLRKRRKNI